MVDDLKKIEARLRWLEARAMSDEDLRNNLVAVRCRHDCDWYQVPFMDDVTADAITREALDRYDQITSGLWGDERGKERRRVALEKFREGLAAVGLDGAFGKKFGDVSVELEEFYSKYTDEGKERVL